MTNSKRRADSSDELSDVAVGHAMWIGSLAGIPAIYAVVALIGLIAGVTLTDSLLIAVWPAIVAGPFFGALVALGMLVRAEEHRAKIVALPTAPAPRNPAARAA